MKFRNKKKKSKLMLLILLLLSVSLGYAFLTTTLNINGTGKINNAKWNIHWENPVVAEGSVVNTLPTIDSLKTTASFNVTLNIPGDYYEFNIDAKNSGTIDGQIETIKSFYNNAEISEQNPLPAYVTFTVTKSDDTAIEVDQRLNAGAKETYKVRVEFKKDIENNELPQSEVELSLKYQITYIQATTPQQGGNVSGGTAIDTIVGKSSPTTSTSEPVAIQHHATDNTPATIDYRYMGANPNNYVYFNCTTDDPEAQDSTNCETWRVIGVVDGKVKLIRTTSLTPQKYNTAEGTNFSQTSLKSNIDTYYNGLQESAKTVIDNSTWYLGSWNYQTGRDDDGYDQLPEGAYVYERSDLVADTGYPETYTGPMALPYPSDYGFSSSTCYSTCLGTGAQEAACANFDELYHLTYPESEWIYDEELGDDVEVSKNYGADACTSTNWMYELTKTNDTWFITPFYDDRAWGTFYGRSFFLESAESTNGANVTVYLKPTAKFVGDGTSANPYKVTE